VPDVQDWLGDAGQHDAAGITTSHKLLLTLRKFAEPQGCNDGDPNDFSLSAPRH
jgi:hypothetical protein